MISLSALIALIAVCALYAVCAFNGYRKVRLFMTRTFADWEVRKRLVWGSEHGHGHGPTNDAQRARSTRTRV